MVLLLDANVLYRALSSMAKAGSADRSAFAELLGHPGFRLIVTASDAGLDRHGVARLEYRIRDKAGPLAPEMVRLWRDQVRPALHVLNPMGFPDTPASAAIRQPERDPDDADLALLGHVLGADAMLSYDRKAFHGLLPVLGLDGAGKHGEVLSAFRDRERLAELRATHGELPMLAGIQTFNLTLNGVGELAERFKIKPLYAQLLFTGVLGLTLFHPMVRQRLGQGLVFYAQHLETLKPDPVILSQIEEAKAAVAPVWEPSSDPLVRAARILARSGPGLTAGELIQRGDLDASPAELAQYLRTRPGLFRLRQHGRFTLAGSH